VLILKPFDTQAKESLDSTINSSLFNVQLHTKLLKFLINGSKNTKVFLIGCITAIRKESRLVGVILA
jgi:hypothetical protein